MGKLIRAATGFAIAIFVLYGQAPWARLQTPAVAAMKADIAAQRPGASLLASLDDTMAALHALLASRNGTTGAGKPREFRAHRLHS